MIDMIQKITNKNVIITIKVVQNYDLYIFKLYFKDLFFQIDHKQNIMIDCICILLDLSTIAIQKYINETCSTSIQDENHWHFSS